MIISPFVIDQPVIPPVFAGRDDEIEIIDNVLFKEHESAALFGNYAIGKSSIIKTIKNQLAVDKKQIFAIGLNTIDFRIAIEGDFLGYITQQICVSIWTDIMDNKYSSLLDNSVTKGKDENFDLSAENTLKKIFRIVTSMKFTGIGKESAEIGAKFFVEGKTGYEYQISTERKPLAAFEFLKLIDELIGIVQSYGYDSLLLTCDEMNHLPRQTNSDFLRTYFEIFSSKKIKFLVTVAKPNDLLREDCNLLLDSFNYLFEISHFKNENAVKQLVSNVLKEASTEIQFSKNGFKTLFELTDGHPWWIQKICDVTFKEAIEKGKYLISSDMLEKQSQQFKFEIEHYQKLIKSGRPFTKYDVSRRT